MLNFILGIIILFAIGTCTVKDACQPDSSGKVYKWCNNIFEKEKGKQ